MENTNLLVSKTATGGAIHMVLIAGLPPSVMGVDSFRTAMSLARVVGLYRGCIVIPLTTDS